MSSAAAQLLGIRRQLLDRIWLGLLLLALIGTPASLARALTTGWIPLYTFHASLAVLVVWTFALRRRLSVSLQSALLLAIFFMIGAAGMLTLGLLGAGFWWLAASTLLAGTLFSQRAAWGVAIATVVLIAVAAVLFTNGVLRMQVDPAAYAYSPMSWISFLLVAAIMPFVLFQSITLFQRSTVELLEKVDHQRDEIQRLATHDALTGLARWDLAQDRLEHALDGARRGGDKVGVLFIDLDGFKQINDTRGHEAGDHVLRAVAERLVGALGGEGAAARAGGDEFILVLHELSGATQAEAVAARIIAAVSAPIALPDGPVSVSASIGIALFPDHAADVKGLRRCADAAMYAAKSAGKNRAVLAVAAA